MTTTSIATPTTTDNAEEWRPVEGFLGLYEVSNLGQVRSLDAEVISRPDGIGTRSRKGRILRTKTPKHGYQMVSFSKNCRVTYHLVHRLVAAAFLPQPPETDTVNHIDFDRSNNRATNLEWCTPFSNWHHSGAAGRNCMRLNADIVAEIRERAAAGESHRDIGKTLGIGKSTVGAVLLG